MYTFYESGVDQKFYYRAGCNPLTNEFEFYMSLYNQNTQIGRWQLIDMDCLGYVPNEYALYQFKGSETTVRVDSYYDIILDKTLRLTRIEYTALPYELYLDAANDIEKYNKILHSNKPSPVMFGFQPSPVNLMIDKKPIDSKSCLNISMQVLGAFVGILGLAAVCTAFILINSVSMGTFGLVFGIGCAVALSGFGLFGSGYYKKCSPLEPEEPDNGYALPSNTLILTH